MAINDADKQLFESLKDKFKGFDKDGNVVIDDGGNTTSFSKDDFKGLAEQFQQANPTMQAGSYEEGFNKNQFEDISKQGNKFQGFDQSGNLVYRNEKGDLENFGKQGGFADFARKQLGDQKFSMQSQGSANRVSGENVNLNPAQQRQGLGAVANLRRLGGQIANPQNMSSDSQTDTNPAPTPGTGGQEISYQSQMEKNASEQNKQVAQQQAKPKVSAAPSLTGMAAAFAASQAKKQATPVLASAKQQVTQQVTQLANPIVNPIQQQVQQTKQSVGQQIADQTGFNPFSSIQNQAVGKAAEAAGLDSGLAQNALGMLSGNVQKNLQNAAQQQAKQQLVSNVANLAGVDGGMVTQGLNALNALKGGGSTAQKGDIAGKMAARLAAQQALGAATGGLGYLANPELLQAGGAVANKAIGGTAGKALSGSLNTGATALNAGFDTAGVAGSKFADTGARTFKGASEGLKNITKGNIAEGVKGLGSTAVKAALDTFIKNPASVMGSAIGGLGKVGGSVGKAISSVFCFAPDTEILMHDGNYKKIKDIKLDDKVYMGGKVTAIGTAKVDDLHHYDGVEVSGGHAVFENGKWTRVKDSKLGKLISNDEVEVYPMSTEHHLIITKGGQVWADAEEVEDTYNKTDDQIIKELNKDVKRNKVLKAFHGTFHKKV